MGLRAIIGETAVLVGESLILTAWDFAIPFENNVNNKLMRFRGPEPHLSC